MESTCTSGSTTNGDSSSSKKDDESDGLTDNQKLGRKFNKI